jgi:cytochrome c oxidase subunit 1
MTVLTVNLSETSFVHAHFHFVMALFATFAIISGVYYWFPKMSGKSADTLVAKIAFWTNSLGVNVTFWPLFIIGLQGMPRRYWDYEAFPQFEPYHHVATYGAFMIGIGMILTVSNWICAAFKGEKTKDNPWNSRSLEWTHAPSPPGPGNFPEDVTVAPDWTPYDYARKP